MKANEVKDALQKVASAEKAKASNWFFKTGPGQYGENDQFIGVTVPAQRKIATTFRSLPLKEAVELLNSPIHEHRLTGLFILVSQYQRGGEKAKKEIVDTYYKHRSRVNNWDLVDSSAPYILGDYLKTRSSEVLFQLATSKVLWDRRIAMLSTFAWIKDSQFDVPIKMATALLRDQEDLMHKAVGWALREIGKKDETVLRGFLEKHASHMPRTSLRYAIERLSPEDRQYYMKLAP